MSEVEQEQPEVADVPEPDQEPHEPVPDEADEAEHEDEPEPEQDEPAPEQYEARDESEIERAFTSLGKEATRHANRISQIMGEDANMLQPCPRCVTSDPQRPPTPGFIWPHEVVPLLPADKAAVKRSIGEGDEPEFRTNDDAYACPKCNGHGRYETGSFVREQRFIRCDQCDARGWIGQRALGAPAAVVNGAVEPVMVPVGGDEPAPDTDPWGRLRGDPNYGVLPGYTS